MSERVIIERESDGYSVGVPLDAWHSDERFKGMRIVSYEDGSPYDGPKTQAGAKRAEAKADDDKADEAKAKK